MMLLLTCVLPALLSAQDIAVVEKKAGKVTFYNASTGKRLSEVKVGSRPHEMVFSADRKTPYVSDNGMVWMTEKGEGWNTISIIDVAARKKTGVIDPGSYRRPHGLDLNPKTGYLISAIEY
jgi:DNA-binding beta-propeller fold protein YncE